MVIISFFFIKFKIAGKNYAQEEKNVIVPMHKVIVIREWVWMMVCLAGEIIFIHSFIRSRIYVCTYYTYLTKYPGCIIAILNPFNPFQSNNRFFFVNNIYKMKWLLADNVKLNNIKKVFYNEMPPPPHTLHHQPTGFRCFYAYPQPPINFTIFHQRFLYSPLVLVLSVSFRLTLS